MNDPVANHRVIHCFLLNCNQDKRNEHDIGVFENRMLNSTLPKNNPETASMKPYDVQDIA